MHTPRDRLPGELGFMLLALLFSLIMLWAAYGISRFESLSSAGAFPMACAAAMVISGAVNLLGSARSRLKLSEGRSWLQEWLVQVAPATLLMFTGLIVAYMLLLEVLGFLVSSYLFLLVSMFVLGSRRFVLNCVVSALVLAAIFVIFREAFSVLLPGGSLVGPYLPGFLK